MEENGLYLVGTFIDSRAGREWTDKSDVVHQPHEVTVLVGRSTMRVQYRTEADAILAVDGAADGAPLTLRVFPRAYMGRVFYDGQSYRETRS